MSSSGKTYFVVEYDHDEETFRVDNPTSAEKFPHDTWDSVEERWCHLDVNNEMWQDITSLTNELKEKLK
jgi:hypothetical protein